MKKLNKNICLSLLTLYALSTSLNVNAESKVDIEIVENKSVIYKDTDNSGYMNVGDEIIIGGESFYALGFDNTNYTGGFLAKYNLNIDTMTQSETNAWRVRNQLYDATPEFEAYKAKLEETGIKVRTVTYPGRGTLEARGCKFEGSSTGIGGGSQTDYWCGKGSIIKLTITPEEGKEVKTVKLINRLTDEEVGIDENNKFTMPSSDADLIIEYSDKAGDNGDNDDKGDNGDNGDNTNPEVPGNTGDNGDNTKPGNSASNVSNTIQTVITTNPKTGDNIYTYIIELIIGLFGMLLSVKKLKKNN